MSNRTDRTFPARVLLGVIRATRTASHRSPNEENMQRNISPIDLRRAVRFGTAFAGMLMFSAAIQAAAPGPAGAATTSACVKTIEPLADADRTVAKPLDAKHYLNTPSVIAACGSVANAVAKIEKENSAACTSLLQGDLPEPQPDFTNNGDIMKNCGEPSHARALYKHMLARYVPPAPAPSPTPCSNTNASQARLCERMSGAHH